MNLREQLNQISIKHSIPSYQTGGVSENKWEIEDVSKNLLPQKQLKVPEINYLKDWLNSPMAVKIAKTRDPINAQQNINSRLERLSNKNLDIKTVDEANQRGNSFDKRRVKGFDNPNLQGVSYYSPAHNFGSIFTRSFVPENVFVHEGAHASTAGNTLLFKNDVSDILSRVKDDSGKYYSNPTEVQARLNVLRKELKESGIVDPFKTPVTKQQLKTFLNKYKRPTDKTDKPLLEANSAELMNTVKSEDDVLWMLNNIVSNQNNKLIPISQNGGVTDREIQVLKNTAKDNVNQSKQFELEYLNSPKFKERAIKAGYDYDTLKKQLYKNISTQKINFYNDNGKTNGAFFNPSDNSLNFGISKNEDFEDGLINVNGDTVAHEIGHQFSSGKNLDMTKQHDLLEKSNFLLPKDFIGKVKRGYEIATNPNYYREDGHETFNSETIADIHSARKELFDKTGIDLRYSNMTDEAFDIMLKDAFKRKENSFERIFSKIGKDKNKEILNDYFFKSTDPNEIDQIYKKYNTDEKIQKLKKDAEKAMRDNKDVIMNLMNRVVDNNYNNKDLFYAQEGGSLNNIRNILNNIYNKYE